MRNRERHIDRMLLKKTFKELREVLKKHLMHANLDPNVDIIIDHGDGPMLQERRVVFQRADVMFGDH